MNRTVCKLFSWAKDNIIVNNYESGSNLSTPTTILDEDWKVVLSCQFNISDLILSVYLILFGWTRCIVESITNRIAVTFCKCSPTDTYHDKIDVFFFLVFGVE